MIKKNPHGLHTVIIFYQISMKLSGQQEQLEVKLSVQDLWNQSGFDAAFSGGFVSSSTMYDIEQMLYKIIRHV